MEEIRVENAPQPIGPYSQAIVANGFVFVSGQIPSVDGSFKEKVESILENISKILKGAGSSLKDVVKVTVYMKDLSKFGEFNEIYSSYFEKPYPARVVVEVSELPKGAEIEIEVVALSGRS